MGRPKKLFNQKANVTRTEVNRVNAVAEALQANRDSKQDEGIVLGTSDFEGHKEAINAKQAEPEETEPEEIASPSEAERLRLLAQIRERFLNTDTVLVVPDKPEVKKINPVEDKMNEEINTIKAKLGAKQNSNSTRMNIEHYKTLKDLERFWIPFKKHGVLNGLNERELNLLTSVMQEVFDPNYNFDLWCSHCVGEFLKDLYTYFEKWQEEQKEVIAEYDTVLTEDKF